VIDKPASVDPQPPAPAPVAAPRDAAPAPDATPVDSVGDARWSDTLGFYRQAESRQADTGAGTPPSRAPRVKDATLNVSHLRIGIGRSVLNPVVDGRSNDTTGISVLDIPADIRFEWRQVGGLLSAWLGFETGYMVGERKIEDPSGVETQSTLGLSGLRAGARFGLDVNPVEYIGVGPLIGARADLYRASLETKGVSSTKKAEFSPDLGYSYGLHARLRTKARPGAPALLYADPSLFWKKGEFETAQYLSLDLGVRVGDVYFSGWYERRVGSTGRFTVDVSGSSRADATTLSEAYAASMPAEQRLGVGIAILMAGVQ
jgi:hypothetical protein